ncbi:hypothetical protein [Streptomyces cinereoruber]|uniref:hypothetical protein n=1 Tax=Streptomyces cinereoruber TaxID=67260 RepID=UPI0036668877
MLRWAAGLLPPPARARAVAELDATGLSVAAAPFYPVRHGMRAALHDTRPVNERQGPSGRELVAALRSVETAVDGDRLLDAARVDWDVLAAAHARDPFPSLPSRALIARRDCPDPFTVALLTPWRVEVANRIAARQKNRTGPAERRSAYRAHTAPLVHCHDLSDEIRKVLLPHVSHLRTPLLRLLLAPGKAREVVRATARLDRLLAAVDHGDHGHLPRIQAFWDAVGAELRDTLGEDRTAWTAVARRLTRHKGSLRELLDTLGDPVPGSRKHGPDLRVLIQAPPSVLTAIVADLDDAALERAAERYVGDDRVRTADGLLVTALAQLERAGVAPRRPLARWAHGALAHRPGELAEVAWLYGGSPDLDGSLIRLARLRPDLRRRLAAAHVQPPPAVDPVAELREQHDAVRAQLVLDSSCPDDTPWPRLLEAHAAEPLPEPVLWVLASRPGFPAVLARALPGARTEDLAAQGADAARHALAHLAGRSPGDVLDHCSCTASRRPPPSSNAPARCAGRPASPSSKETSASSSATPCATRAVRPKPPPPTVTPSHSSTGTGTEAGMGAGGSARSTPRSASWTGSRRIPRDDREPAASDGAVTYERSAPPGPEESAGPAGPWVGRTWSSSSR